MVVAAAVVVGEEEAHWDPAHRDTAAHTWLVPGVDVCVVCMEREMFVSSGGLTACLSGVGKVQQWWAGRGRLGAPWCCAMQRMGAVHMGK